MNITNEERINKYIQEHCVNCKNENDDLCEIHIFVEGNVIKTKCDHYDRK